MDSHKLALLKFVCFPAVSSQIMISVFTNFSIEYLDYDVFENLKQRLFCEVTMLNLNINFNRWTDKPKFLSESELQQILRIFNCKLQEDQNLVDLIRLIVEKYQNSNRNR